MKMRDLNKNAATVAAWILAFAAIGWMAIDTFAAGGKSSGATVIEDDLTTGSAGSVGLSGGIYDVSGSLGQVATVVSQSGPTESAGGYFAFDSTPTITDLAAAAGTFNGSVKLTWSWPGSLSAGSSFYVMYSTFTAGMDWDPNKAKIIIATGPVTLGPVGATFVVGGLDTGRDGVDGIITPTYYFRVFSKPAGGSLSESSNEASQAPLMPGILSTATWVNFGAPGTPGGGWLQTVNGSANGNDVGYAVAHDDTASDVYVAGLFRNAAGNDDIFVRRYGPNGDTRWTKYYNSPGNGNDWARRVWVGNGQVYVVGTENRADLGQNDNLLLINYSTAGVLQWTTTYNSPDNLADSGNGVDVDGTGITVAGLETRSAGGVNVLVQRYGFDASLQWTRTYDSGGSDYANQVKGDGANVYVLGEAYGGAGNGPDLWLRKYSIAGTMQWTTTYNSPYSLTDRGMGLSVKNGNLYVSGDQYVDGSGNSDALLQKYDLSANLVWQKTVASGGGRRTWHEVATDPGGLGVFVAGREGPGANTDIVVKKYDNTGLVEWTTTYAGPYGGNDEGVGIHVSKSSNVYVAGYERRSVGQGDDVWVRRYNKDAFQGGSAGTTKIWAGTNGGSASLGTNWFDGFPPVNGDYVVFGATNPQNNCNWDLSISLSSVTINGSYFGQVQFTNQLTVTDKFEMLAPFATAYFSPSPSNKHRIEGLTSLSTGVFRVEGTTLTALSAVDVTSGTLAFRDGAVFEGAEIGALGSDGAFILSGPLPPVLTSSSTTSGLKFAGLPKVVDISSGIFRRLTSDGLKVGAGATVVSLSSITFEGPLPPGTTAINFYGIGTIVSTFTNVAFDDPNIAVNVNATPLNTSSRITMRDFHGSQAGESLDNDPPGFPEVVEWPTPAGQAATPFNVAAAVGPMVGSVKLTWQWPESLAPGGSYRIQYATYPSANWDYNNAQIVMATGPVTLGAGGATHIVGGLDVGRDGGGTDNSPFYYFRIFAKNNTGTFSLPSTTVQNKPALPSVETTNFTGFGASPVPGGGWLSRVNGSGTQSDSFHSVARSTDGGVYVVGNFYDAGPNTYLRKYDAAGSVIWTRYYNSPADGIDQGLSVAVDPYNNAYVGGLEARADLGQGNNMLLMKFQPSGLREWTTAYNSPDNLDEELSGVAADGSGVYVAGQVVRSGTGANILVRKYSPDALLQWTTTYNGPGNGTDAATAIALDGASLYVSGFITVAGQGTNIWLGKYDTSGNPVWQRSYNSPSNGNDEGGDVAAYSGGVYLVGNEDRSDVTQSANAWVRKYDASGATIWTNTFNYVAGNTQEKAQGVAAGPAGLFVVGYQNRGASMSDIWVRKYDFGGLAQWTTTYDDINSDEDEAIAAAISDNADLYVAGWERTAGISTQDAWLRKYNYDAFGGGAGGLTNVRVNTVALGPSTMGVNANDTLLMGATIWSEGGSVTISSVTVSLLGSAPATQLTAKVIKDLNGNGVFDFGSEPVLSTMVFAAGSPPKAALVLSPSQVITGTSQYYLFTVSQSSVPMGKTVEFSIETPSDLTASGGVLVGNFPLRSGPRTVWGEVYAKPANIFVPYTEPAVSSMGGFDTGFYVNAGQQFVIETNPAVKWNSGSGLVTSTGNVGGACGTCVVSSTNSGRLIYRVGSGGWAPVPSIVSTLTVTGGGNLVLGMNDIPGSYGDNSGYISLNFKVMTSSAAKVWVGGTAGYLNKANLDSNWAGGKKPYDGETVWLDNSAYDCDWDIPNITLGMLAMTTGYTHSLRIVQAAGLANTLFVSSSAYIGRGTLDLQGNSMEVQGSLMVHSSATLDLAQGTLKLKYLSVEDAAFLRTNVASMATMDKLTGGPFWEFHIRNATVTVNNTAGLKVRDSAGIHLSQNARVNVFNKVGIEFSVATSSPGLSFWGNGTASRNFYDWYFDANLQTNVDATRSDSGSVYNFYNSTGAKFGTPFESDPNNMVFWSPDGGGTAGTISGRLDYSGAASGSYQLRVTTMSSGIMGAGQVVGISSGAVGYTLSNLPTPATYYVFGFKSSGSEPWNDQPRGGVGNPGAWRSQALFLDSGAALSNKDITIQDWGTVSGNITLNTSQTGSLRLHAWRGTDPPCGNCTLEARWYANDAGGVYSFYAPPASDYTIIAFKDVDNDDATDAFEAVGSSSVIEVASLATHSNTDITVSGGGYAPGGVVYLSTHAVQAAGAIGHSGVYPLTRIKLYSHAADSTLNGIKLEYAGERPAGSLEMSVYEDSNANGVLDTANDNYKGMYMATSGQPSSGTVQFYQPDTIVSGSTRTYFLSVYLYSQFVSSAGIRISTSANFALGAGEMANQASLYPVLSTAVVRFAVPSMSYAYANNSGGSYTNFRVDQGQALHLEASGLWRYASAGGQVGPGGLASSTGQYTILPSANVGELIGRVQNPSGGSSPWFRVGASTDIASMAYSGELVLAMNDYVDSFYDNSGDMFVGFQVSGSTVGALEGTVNYAGGQASSMTVTLFSYPTEVSIAGTQVKVATITGVGGPTTYNYSFGQLTEGWYGADAQHLNASYPNHKGKSGAKVFVQKNTTAYLNIDMTLGFGVIGGTLTYSGNQSFGNFLVVAATQTDLGHAVFFGSSAVSGAAPVDFSIPNLPAPATYYLFAIRDGNNNNNLDGPEPFGYYDGGVNQSSSPISQMGQALAPVWVDASGSVTDRFIRLNDKGAINGFVTVSSAVTSGKVYVFAGRGPAGAPETVVENMAELQIWPPVPSGGLFYDIGMLRPGSDYSIWAFLDQNNNRTADGSEPFFQTFSSNTVISSGTYSSYSFGLSQPMAPPPVPNFMAQSDTPDSVLFTWNPVQGATQYELRTLGGVWRATLTPPTTSYQHTGIGPNASSDIRRIVAINPIGTGPATDLPSYRYSLASLPTGLNALSVYQSSATVAWSRNGSPVGTLYEIYRATAMPDEVNPAQFVLAGTTTLTNFTDLGLTPAATYFWRLVSKNQHGNATGPTTAISTSALPSQVAFSIAGTVSYFGSQPGAIYVEANTSSSFGGAPAGRIQMPKVNSQPYFIPLPSGVNHYVRAFVDANGDGILSSGEDLGYFNGASPSAIAVPATGKNFSVQIDTVPPYFPAGLAATAGINQAVLTWGKPTTNANGTPLYDLYGFQVERSSGTPGALYQNLTSVPLSSATLTFTDYSPLAGLQNMYRVRALDWGLNVSSPTAPVSVTPSQGGSISGFMSTHTATTAGAFRVRLSTRSEAGLNFWTAERSLLNQSSYTFTGLSTGTYYVRAFRDVNNDYTPNLKDEPSGAFGGINTAYPIYLFSGNSVPNSNIAVCDRVPLVMTSTGASKLGMALSAGDCPALDKGPGYTTDLYALEVGGGGSGSVGVGSEVEVRLNAPTYEEEVIVLGPSGGVVASNNDPNGVMVRLPLNSTGTYLLETTSFRAGQIGNYDLWVDLRRFSGNINGTVSYPGTGRVMVQLFNSAASDAFPIQTVDWVANGGAYAFTGLSDGTYYVRGFKDVNMSSATDVGEPTGAFGPVNAPTAITITGGVSSLAGASANVSIAAPMVGAVDGAALYTGSQSGWLVIEAGKEICSTCRDITVVRRSSFSVSGANNTPYMLDFVSPATSYIVRAFVDTNGNFSPDIMEAVASSRPVNVVANSTTSVYLELVDPGAGVSGDASFQGTIDTYSVSGLSSSTIFLGWSRNQSMQPLDYTMSILPAGWPITYSKTGIYGGATYYLGAFMDINNNQNPDDAQGEPVGWGAPEGYGGIATSAQQIWTPLSGLTTGNIILAGPPNGGVAGFVSVSSSLMPSAPLMVEAWLPGSTGPGSGNRMQITRLANTTYYAYALGNLSASTGAFQVKGWLDLNLNRFIDPGEPLGQVFNVAITSQAGGSPSPASVNFNVFQAGSMGPGNAFGQVEGTINYAGTQPGSFFIVRFFNNSTYYGLPVSTFAVPAAAVPGSFGFMKGNLPLGTYWMDAYRASTVGDAYNPTYQAYGKLNGAASVTLTDTQPYAFIGVGSVSDPGTAATGSGSISGNLQYNGTSGGGMVRASLRPMVNGVAQDTPVRNSAVAYNASTAFSFTNVSTGPYIINAFVDVNQNFVPDATEPVAVSSATGVWLQGPTLTGQNLLLCDRSPITQGVDAFAALTSTDCVAPDRGGAYQKLYTFQGTRGQAVTITLRALGFTDSFLNLYDPLGNRVMFDDESDGSGNARITGFMLPKEGLYTIAASAYAPGITGAFKLSLTGASNMGQTGSIAGAVNYSGSQGGQIMVALFSSSTFQPNYFVADRTLVSTRNYVFDNLVTGASYYLGAYVDVNLDRVPSSGEDKGMFGSNGQPYAIFLQNGQNLAGIDIPIEVSTVSASYLGFITGFATYTATSEQATRLVIEAWPTASMTGQPSAVREVPVTLSAGVNNIAYDLSVPGNAMYFLRGFLDNNPTDYMPSPAEAKGIYAPYQGAEGVWVPAGGSVADRSFTMRNPGVDASGLIAGQGTASLWVSSAPAGAAQRLTLTYTAGANGLTTGMIGFMVPPGWGMPMNVVQSGGLNAPVVNGPSVMATVNAPLGAGLTQTLTFDSWAPCMQGYSTFTVVSARASGTPPAPLFAGSPAILVGPASVARFQPRNAAFSVRQDELSDQLWIDGYDTCGNKTQVADLAIGHISTVTLNAKMYVSTSSKFDPDASFGFSTYTAISTVTVLPLYFEVGSSSKSFYVKSASTGPKAVELIFYPDNNDLTKPSAFFYGFAAMPSNALTNVSVTTSPVGTAGKSVTLYPGDPTKANMAFFGFALGDPTMNWRILVSSMPFKVDVEPVVLWERWGYGMPAPGEVSWDGRYSPWLNNGVRVPNGVYYVRIQVGSGVKDESLKVTISAPQISGKVYDVGKIPSLPLSGVSLDAYGPAGAKAWSDSVGSFVMPGLTAGWYQIFLNKTDYLSGWASVKLESDGSISSWTAATDAVGVSTNASAGLDFSMRSPPVLTVTGEIGNVSVPTDRWGSLAVRKSTSCAGGAVSGDTLWGPLRLKAGTTTFDDGGQWDPATQQMVERQYLRFQVAVATYAVKAEFMDFSPACTTVYVDAAGVSLNFPASSFAKKSSISGTVTVPANASGMYVSVNAMPVSTATSNGGFGGVWLPANTLSLAYTVPNLDAGDYMLRANTPNYPAQALGPMALAASVDLPGKNFNFTAGRTITGNVTVPAGAPQAAVMTAYVNAWAPSASSTTFAWTQAVKGGGAASVGYTLTGLDNNTTYQIFVYLQGSEGMNLEAQNGLPMSVYLAGVDLAGQNVAFVQSAGVIVAPIKLPAGSVDFKNVDLYGSIVASPRPEDVGRTFQIIPTTSVVLAPPVGANGTFRCHDGSAAGLAMLGSGDCPAGVNIATVTVPSLPTQTIELTLHYKTTGRMLKQRISVTNGQGTNTPVFDFAASTVTFKISGEIINQVNNSVFKSSSAGSCFNIVNNSSNTVFLTGFLTDAKGALIKDGSGSNVSLSTAILAIRQEFTGYNTAVSTTFNPATDRFAYITNSGVFEISNLSPGSYFVKTGDLRFCSTCTIAVPSVGQLVHVSNVNRSSVNFTLSDGYGVSGKVYFDESITTSAMVGLTVLNRRREVVRSTVVFIGDAGLNVTANSADYSFSNLPSGEYYSLRAADLGSPAKYAAKPIRFPDPTSEGGLQSDLTGQDVLLQRGAFITGRMKDAKTGEMITGANATLLAETFEIKAVANPFVEGGYVLALSSVSGRPVFGDGYFRVGPLIPKLNYDLKLSQTKWDPGFIAKGSQNYNPAGVGGLLLQPGETRDAGVVDLYQGLYLKGVVYQSTTTGPTLGNIKVTAKPSFGDSAVKAETYTNPQGAYTLWVSTNINDVTAAPADGNLASNGTYYAEKLLRTVNLLNTATADFLLDPLRGLTSTYYVVTADSGSLSYPFGDKKGFPAAAVNLQPVGIVPVSNPLGDIESITNADGSFTLPALATGTYFMRVTSLGYVVAKATVTIATATVRVADGATGAAITDYKIWLQKGGSVSGRILKRDGSSPSQDEVGGVGAANFAAGEFVIGSVEFDPTAKTVNSYSLSGFKAGTSYDIVILPKDKKQGLPVFPPEGKGFSVASATTTLSNYTLSYPANPLDCTATSKGLGNLQFQVKIECTDALRNETDYDNDLSQILAVSNVASPDALPPLLPNTSQVFPNSGGSLLNSDKEMHNDRRKITAIYRSTSTSETSFSLRLKVYSSQRSHQTGEYYYFDRIFDFFTGLDSHSSGKVSNIQGGSVSLVPSGSDESQGRDQRSGISFGAGTFEDESGTVCASCTVTVGVSKIQMATAKEEEELAKKLGKISALGLTSTGTPLRPMSVPAEMEMAIQAYRVMGSTKVAGVNALSSFYSIFLPASVRHQLKTRADLTLSFDTLATSDTSKVDVYYYNYSLGRYVVESTDRRIDTANKTITVSVDHLSTFVVLDGAPTYSAAGTLKTEKIHAFSFPNPGDCITHTGLTADTAVGQIAGGGATHNAFQGVMIRYSLPNSGAGKFEETRINIYNVAGELVRVINQGYLEGNKTYYMPWNCGNQRGGTVGSGIYFAEIVWGSQRQFFKIAIIKGSGL